MVEPLDQLLELFHLHNMAILLSRLVAMPVTWMKKLHDLNYLSLLTISPTSLKQGIFGEWQKPWISFWSYFICL